MSPPNERLTSISEHLVPATSTRKSKIYSKNSDDVVITLAVRTPLTKAKKGFLKDTKLDEMLYLLLLVRRPGRLVPQESKTMLM